METYVQVECRHKLNPFRSLLSFTQLYLSQTLRGLFGLNGSRWLNAQKLNYHGNTSLSMLQNWLNNMNWSVALKRFAPPIVTEALISLGFAGNRFKYGFASWSAAQAECSGYEDESIMNSVIESSRRVRDGNGLFERDGVVFDSPHYTWPLIASVLGAPRTNQHLTVLDWGGALGSTYRQNKPVLEASNVTVQWVVVEQKYIKEIGVAEFQNSELTFVDSLKGQTEREFDLAIFASSICYVENPSAVIREVVSLSPKRIVFDRTPETRSTNDLIGVQKVGRRIYKASYPVWAFAPGTLEKMVGPKYKLSFDWISEFQPDPKTISKGYCFDRTN